MQQTISAIMRSSSVRKRRTPNPAGRRGNHALVRHVFLFFDRDSKKFQATTNPGADRARVLSDATREHHSVQSAQRRCVCAAMDREAGAFFFAHCSCSELVPDRIFEWIG